MSRFPLISSVTGAVTRTPSRLLLRTRLRSAMLALERRTALRTVAFRPIFVRLAPFRTRIGVFRAVVIPPARHETARTLAFRAILHITVVAITWRRPDFEFVQLVPFGIGAITIGNG